MPLQFTPDSQGSGIQFMPGTIRFTPEGGEGIYPLSGGISPFLSPPAYYSSLIREEAQKLGIDPNQALTLAKFESNLNPTAKSSAGAYGLMQVMPGSAGGMDISDPRQNVIRGLQLWKDALRRGGGNPRTAYRQYYNPGYTGPGPFGAAANISSPQPLPTAPPPINFTPQRISSTPPSKPGFGQFISTIANAPGIRDVGDFWRQTLGRRQPVYAHTDLERGIYTNAGLIVDEAGQVFNKNGTPITTSQAEVLMGLFGFRAGPTPGGPEAAQLARRLIPRGIIPPSAPVHTQFPPVPSPGPQVPALPLAPISLGEPGLSARTLIPQTIRTARRADDYARGTMAAQAGRQANAISTYLSPDYKAITSDQHRQLFYSMFTPDSPIVTGKWPEWVSPRLQTILTKSYRRTQESFASLRDLTPEQREFLLGRGDAGETPYFPLLSAKYAAERMQLGALGRRRLHRGAGGLKAREFYSLRLPDGTSSPGMIQGNALLRWIDGKWNEIGRVARKAPGQTVETSIGQVTVNPANPLELKRAGIHEYIENAFQTLFEREDDLTTALNVRRLIEHWKTDPQFQSIIAPPGSTIPRGWVRAPWLGEDYYVEPHLADVAKRLGGMTAGNPARISLLNNWSLNISFGLWPFAHYRNMIFNWTIATRGLGLTRPDLFAKAFRDTNEFSPEYIRYMERGGATHYLDIQRRRILEATLEGLNQNPRAKPVLSIGGAIGSYQNWQQAVNWKMDAILTMQAIRYFQGRGLPLDSAIDLAIKRIPQYYVPAVFAAPRGLQGAADVARFIAQDSRAVVFNPFHFSQAKNLQTALGIQGFKTLAALALMDRVIWPKMEGALQYALVDYYTRRGDIQAARKTSRVHITEPGYGRIVEGTRVASQMLADVLRSAPQGSRLSEGLSEAGPALGTFSRSLVTASPELQTILSGFNLLMGKDPNLENLLPFGTIQEAARTVSGQASPLEAGLSFTGIYPRYYLPLEFQAIQVRNSLPRVAARIYAMNNSGQEQQADQLLEQTQTHLYTLNLAATHDLQRRGFRIDDPVLYASTLTEAELSQAGLSRKPRFRLHPRRPSLAPPTPQLAPQ